MKAVVARGVGGPEQLAVVEWPQPVLAAGEVLVKVGATSVNHADKWLLQGMLGPLPLVPGIDVAGTIVDAAPDVRQITTGTRVLLNPAITCGACSFCDSGEHGLCPERKALGQQLDGGFAEYVKVPSSNALPIRDDLSFEEAAAIPSAFFTAWMLLTRRVALGPGTSVLVMAAASGVGSAAVQLARLHGANVIAAAGSEEKLARVRDWGAHSAVNYTRDDWPDRVLDLTDGQGAEVVVDAVGPAFWGGYARCTRRSGKIIAFSMTSGRFGEVDVDTLIRRQISFLGSSPQGSRSVAREVMALVNDRKLTGIVDRVWPLERVVKAELALLDRQVIGKIILQP